MDLREKVRTWLIDAKIGLIETAELVARADRAIAGLEGPPDYLISLSLGEPLYHVERLDLVKEPMSEKDLGKLAARLLERLETETISLETVAAVAARITFPRDEAAVDVWTHFNWITDEFDLIEGGIKDDSRYREEVSAELRAAAQYADESLS